MTCKLSLIAIALLIAGCTVTMTRPTLIRVIPAKLTECPPGAVVPTMPGKIRTTESIAAWALRLRGALAESEKARAECEARLHTLNKWVESYEDPNQR